MTKKYLCIHGHFYQPPREDPWIEAIEPQESAAPWENWNARISSECYAPNGVSRIRGPEGDIVSIANNYAHISFNFGPTLLSWMAEHDPDSLSAIVEGDRISATRLNGHGNAIAQAYNHMIMPLASARDRRTQVLWGIADFEFRFGRKPEGMWLPETAANTESLEALADAGILFTILAPRQAKRWRRIDDGQWLENSQESVDTGRAYQVVLPSGKTISVFFYDGDIAQGIAFTGLLDSGAKLATALREAASDKGDNFLVHSATDGESYGHHHKFGDMALAWALNDIHSGTDLEISNYAAFLAEHPPIWEAEIVENSSWSCVHGVERWRSDCGCSLGTPGYNQRWRKPLREGLDALKQELDKIYEHEASSFFQEPWSVRDAYIEIVLQRGKKLGQDFLRRHAGRELDIVEQQHALSLLEMQRNGMLMFTSCGWFFDEISGLEGRQILRYAARAIQLAEEFAPSLEDSFLAFLAQAESNDKAYRTGEDLWKALVRPQRVPLDRVAAHYAISALFDQRPKDGQLYSYFIEDVAEYIDSAGDRHLAMGQVTVKSRLTLNSRRMHFALLHFAGLDLKCWVHDAKDEQRFIEQRDLARRLFASASMGDVYEQLRQSFSGQAYELDDMFPRERAQLIDSLMAERLQSYHSVLSGLVQPDLGLVERLWRMHYPLPQSLRLATDIYVEQEIVEAIKDMDVPALEQIKSYQLRGHRLSRKRREKLSRLLEQTLVKAICDDDKQGRKRALRLLEAATLLKLEVKLWSAQNALLKQTRSAADDDEKWLAQRLDLNPALLASR